MKERVRSRIEEIAARARSLEVIAEAFGLAPAMALAAEGRIG